MACASLVLRVLQAKEAHPWIQIHSLLARNRLQKQMTWADHLLEVHEFVDVYKILANEMARKNDWTH